MGHPKPSCQVDIDVLELMQQVIQHRSTLIKTLTHSLSLNR
jgi:hypothetical protein